MESESLLNLWQNQWEYVMQVENLKLIVSCVSDDDLVFGGAGSDLISAGEGNDVLDGGGIAIREAA